MATRRAAGIQTRIAARVRRAVAHPDLPPAFAAQIGAVIDRKLALYQRAPIWCVPELPRRAAEVLGAPARLGESLAAACIVYHCAADVVDDAQDGELQSLTGFSGDWSDAITVGLYLLSAHGALLAEIEAAATVRAAWARAFGQAGMKLTIGQHRDLQLAADDDLDEAAIIDLGAAKAGAAVGAFLSLPAIWAGLPNVPAWQAAGVAIGRMLQVSSDLEAYMGHGPHADLAIAKLTVPLRFALDIEPTLAQLWRVGLPLDATRQARLRAAVRAADAVTYTRMRVDILKCEAEAAIASLAVDGLAEALAPVLATAIWEDAEGPL